MIPILREDLNAHKAGPGAQAGGPTAPQGPSPVQQKSAKRLAENKLAAGSTTKLRTAEDRDELDE